MKKCIGTSSLILCLTASLIAQISSIEKAMFELPDVIFEKLETPDNYASAYKLLIKQPIDHSNPTYGHFYQKAYLSHKSMDAPTVMITQGYHRNSSQPSELCRMLQANQIDIEHRFFGESIPDSVEYKFLNLEQATADLHHINSLFKAIYKNKWLSTGISKGGQTTIYYRYFYPDDVDVSIPYVAPLNLKVEDDRIYTFLDTIGTDKCRTDILRIQKMILQNREESFRNLRWFSKGAKLKYSYLTFEQAMEYAVLEYPFSFWQWGGICEEIPAADASLDEVLDHFLEVSGVSFFADGAMETYEAHYYQAGTEMGYYSYDTEGFEDLLEALPTTPNPSAVFMPHKMKYTFDNTLPKKAYDWITDHGDYFIYINGADDTWSSTAVPVNKERKALWFNMPGADHGEARIKNMTDADRQKLIMRLEKWLDVDVIDVFNEK